MNKSIKVLRPSYYGKFHCIAEKCENTCCGGWGITIDKRSYMRYRKIKEQPYADTISSVIKRNRDENASDDAYAYIVLDKHQKCPLITEDGLCLIHKQYGHDALCVTCKIYPRMGKRLDASLPEASMTLSCPQVARIALFDTEPMSFDVVDVVVSPDDVISSVLDRVPPHIKDSDLGKLYWQIRSACIDVMQMRKFTIPERLLLMGMMMRRIAQCGEHVEALGILRTFLSDIEAMQSYDISSLPFNEDHASAIHAFLIAQIYRWGDVENYKRAIYSKIVEIMRRECGETFGTLEDGGKIEAMYRVSRRHRAAFDELVRQRDYVFENFFVNHMFSTAYPATYYADGLNPFHHFMVLAEQYAFLKLMLSVLAVDGCIYDDVLLEVMYTLAASTAHSDLTKHITTVYKAYDADALSHVSFLLR